MMTGSKPIQASSETPGENLGLLANGSSGSWEVSIDESVSGTERSFAQIEGPSLWLCFEIPSSDIIPKIIQFLLPPGTKREEMPSCSSRSGGKLLDISEPEETPVSLVRDDKYRDRCFILVGRSDSPIVRFSVASEDLDNLVEALRQVEEEFAGHPRGQNRGRGALMGKRGRGRPRSGQAAGGNPHERPGKSAGPIGLTAVEGSPDAYELVHPHCVEEMEPDFQEGLELWKAGDPEEARDALRYTLQACPANLWVHVALGRIALEEFRDPILARGHFGYAVELVRKVLPASFSGRLPRDRPANAPFYDAVEGLVRCFRAQAMPREAESLAAFARRLQEA